MIFLTENIFLKIGLTRILEDFMQSKPVGTDHVVVFDRGDGMISVLPIEYALALKMENMKLYDFLSYEFISFDAKNPCDEIREKIISLFQGRPYAIRPRQRKPISDCERLLLECFFSGKSVRDIAKNISGIKIHSLYAKKNKAFRKLGVRHNAAMLKMLRNWEIFF